jgi:hypothetical protein
LERERDREREEEEEERGRVRESVRESCECPSNLSQNIYFEI